MISERDISDCADALVEWFKTQELMPADASLVMFRTVASQLVAKSTDVVELQKAINNVRLLLTLEVAAMLKVAKA